jgi:hypothetical protein
MKKLTSYLYDFERMIHGDFLYVDKTEYVWKLIQNNAAGYFLSRPRRFGKSLLLSTLKAVFEGKRDLFKGLALYDKPYDWKQYPVIHIDLGSCQSKSAEILEMNLQAILESIAKKLGIPLRGNTAQSQFENLLFDAAKIAPPVVLIDEYDNPILEILGEKEDARAIQSKINGFYSVIKTSSPLLRFVFLTGVNKFCLASEFSGLNNLTDISMDARFATMLGYTQEEFEQYFAEYIAQTEAKQELPHDEYLAEIKRWYSGFRFDEKAEAVYNPVAIANFFTNNGDFRYYWSSTGSPLLLIDLMKQRHFELERTLREPVSNMAFSANEVDNLEVLPLGLQTGYLTIHHSNQFDEWTLYYLDFPNIDVKSSFDYYLLNAYTGIDQVAVNRYVASLIQYVQTGNVDGFRECLEGMLAAIPYDLYIKQEKYFQTIIYLLFLLLGVYIEAEAHTNIGRIDAVASYGDWVYIFEFKIDQDEEVAFEQIMARQYYQKYQHQGKKIVLIGANFSYEKRQLDGWKTKQL